MSRSLQQQKTDPIMPGAFPTAWLSYAEECGLSQSELIFRARISEEASVGFSHGIRFSRVMRLMELITSQLGEHCHGFEVGWRLSLPAYENVGHAILSSGTLHEAMNVLNRFWPLIARSTNLNISVDEHLCILTLMPSSYLSHQRQHYFYETAIASLYKNTGLLLPTMLDHVEVWFSDPPPLYANEILKYIPHTRFEMPETQFRFPSSLLDQPLALANQYGHRLALAQCSVDEMGLDIHRSLVLNIQNRLKNLTTFPSLEKMASTIGMSPRSLRRHLSIAGSSYSGLLEAAKRRTALHLLDNKELDISEIASQLGYFDAANFTRAFKKITGMTPSEYRAKTLS